MLFVIAFKNDTYDAPISSTLVYQYFPKLLQISYKLNNAVFFQA